MKKRIVLWANDQEDKKFLLGVQLLEKENKINLYKFSNDIVTEEFYNKMMDEWRTEKEVEFPEGHETIVRELSVTEDILPEDLKVQRADLINRAKAEWHFVVLSNKLFELYNSELEDLKGRIDQLVNYDGGMWEEMKGFWSKISSQARERNLFREHADKLKDETNKLFEHLKQLRSKANEELGKVSKEHVETLANKLDKVAEKVEKGLSLGPLFDELKKIQQEFKNAELTRNDRNKLWKKIDQGFKTLKEKKYGKQPESQGNMSRLEKRLQGLLNAIGKMENSIKRDKGDIDFQNKRAGQTHGQLEAQLRQAKIMMIEERINSKDEKLKEMLQTKAELEGKIAKEKVRDEKRAEKEEIKKKQLELKEKKDAEIASKAQEISPEEAEKLKAAADTLKKKPKPPKKETILSAAAAVIGDAVEDVVDSVKAVAEVVSEKAADKAEEISEKIEANEKLSAAKEKIKEVKDKLEDKIEATTNKLEIEEKVDAMKAKTEDLKDKITDASDKVADKVNIDDTIADAKDVLEESESAIADKGSSVSDTLKKGGLLGAAVAIGSKLMDNVSDAVEDVAEKLGVEDKLEDAKEKLADIKEDISEKVAEVKEEVSEKVDEVKGKVEATKATSEEDLDSVVDRIKNENSDSEEE